MRWLLTSEHRDEYRRIYFVHNRARRFDETDTVALVYKRILALGPKCSSSSDPITFVGHQRSSKLKAFNCIKLVLSLLYSTL